MGKEELIDARGLICPLPVLRLAKRMRAKRPGSTICILVDDPAARVDIPHYCSETGHILLAQEEFDDHEAYTICHGLPMGS